MKEFSEIESQLSISKSKILKSTSEIASLKATDTEVIINFIYYNKVLSNTVWKMATHLSSNLKTPPHLVLSMKDGSEKDSLLFGICKLMAEYEFDEMLIDRATSILSLKNFNNVNKFSDLKICIYFDDINIIMPFCKANNLIVDASDITFRTAVLNKELQRLNELIHVLNIIK